MRRTDWLDKYFSGLDMLGRVIVWFVAAVFVCSVLGIIEANM